MTDVHITSNRSVTHVFWKVKKNVKRKIIGKTVNKVFHVIKVYLQKNIFVTFYNELFMPLESNLKTEKSDENIG